MRQTFAIATVVLVVGLTLVAQQQDKSVPHKLDGMNLLKACDEPESATKDGSVVQAGVDRGYCFGVVRGVSFWLLPKGCSDDVTIGQEVLVVSKYLRGHPEE